MVNSFFKKNIKSFLLIRNTSLVKVINYPLNFFILLFLISYFNQRDFAILVLAETLIGLFLAGLYSSQNTIAIRYIGDFDNQTRIILSTVYLKLILFLLLLVFSFCASLLFHEVFVPELSLKTSIYFIFCIALYAFLNDLFLFFSLLLILKKKYVHNFLVMLIIPLSSLTALFVTYFNSDDIINFISLRAFLPLIILLCALLILLFTRIISIKYLLLSPKVFYQNVHKILISQAPLMPAGFLTYAAHSIPVLIFGYQQNTSYIFLLGFLERVFNPFRNAFQTLVANLHPHFFEIFRNNQDKGFEELFNFSRLFITISLFVLASSFLFYLLFIFSSNEEPSSSVYFLFLFKFLAIVPLVIQMICNISFYFDKKTILISKLTLSRSFINLSNIFVSNFGVQWILFVYFMASALPALYSVNFLTNNDSKFRYLSFLILISFLPFLILFFILF